MNIKTIFEDMYKKYYKSVYFITLDILKDVGVSEDITHDIFIKLYTKLTAGERIKYPSAWLVRSAKNSCLNFIRNTRRCVVSDDLATEIKEEFEAVDDMIYISGVLECLEEEEKEIFISHTMGGLKLTEIASNFNYPASTVRWKYANARKKIRVSLNNLKHEEMLR